MRPAAYLRAALVTAGAVAAGGDSGPAATVVAFTVSAVPLTNAGGAAVYELDTAHRLEEPDVAPGGADTGLRGSGVSEAALRRSLAGRLLAGRLGVERLPAVVVDGEAVVYGVADVGEAVARIEAWRGGDGRVARIRRWRRADRGVGGRAPDGTEGRP